MKMATILAWLFLVWVPLALATDAPPDAKDTKDDGAPADLSVKPLDGVTIEAVENYPNTNNHELGFGVGFYPFKPYYYGFSFNADYIYYFNKTFGWEVVNAGYAITANTNLTTQLADKWSVAPQSIERLQAIFSSNLLITHTHGKLLFLDQYIRYFRSQVIAGPGMVMTSKASQASVNLGLRFDAFVTESFSWKLEVRDMITLSGLENYVSVTLGTGINF